MHYSFDPSNLRCWVRWPNKNTYLRISLPNTWLVVKHNSIHIGSIVLPLAILTTLHSFFVQKIWTSVWWNMHDSSILYSTLWYLELWSLDTFKLHYGGSTCFSLWCMLVIASLASIIDFNHFHLPTITLNLDLLISKFVTVAIRVDTGFRADISTFIFVFVFLFRTWIWIRILFRS